MHAPSISPFSGVDSKSTSRDACPLKMRSIDSPNAIFTHHKQDELIGFRSILPPGHSYSFDQDLQPQRRKKLCADDIILEKKKAHIVSEQKRRQNINDGFEELKQIIPACSATTDSKAVILRKGISLCWHFIFFIVAVNYIKSLEAQLVHNTDLIQRHPIHSKTPRHLKPHHSSPLPLIFHGAASIAHSEVFHLNQVDSIHIDPLTNITI